MHIPLLFYQKKLEYKVKKNMSVGEINNYNKLLFIDYYSDVRHLYQKNQHLPKDFIDEYHDNDKLNQIWEFIYNLSPFEKRIMYLKYNYFFNEQKTNKIISELMCCSGETIRKTLISIKGKIRNEFCNIF